MQKLAKILIAVLKQHCNSSNPELKFPPFQLSCNLMQEWYIFARPERLETGRQQVITKINWNHQHHSDCGLYETVGVGPFCLITIQFCLITIMYTFPKLGLRLD